MSATRAFAHADRRGVPFAGEGGERQHAFIVIASVPPVAFARVPTRWDDAEVVDGVLVDAPPRAPLTVAGTAAGVVYDRSGRVAPFARYGRLVSVVA